MPTPRTKSPAPPEADHDEVLLTLHTQIDELRKEVRELQAFQVRTHVFLEELVQREGTAFDQMLLLIGKAWQMKRMDNTHARD